MSGHCNDCGNQICICSEIRTESANKIRGKKRKAVKKEIASLKNLIKNDDSFRMMCNVYGMGSKKIDKAKVQEQIDALEFSLQEKA